MLTAENESSSERIADLEKKVQELEDECICLKGTLVDVIRRLAVLESKGGEVEHWDLENVHLHAELEYLIFLSI